MKIPSLLAQFDRIANSPDAVPHLRKFVIELAVRGKLTEQGCSEATASDLLVRIQDEKRRREKEGEIRRQQPTPPIQAADQLFRLPTGWAWVRFGEVADFSAGKTPARHDSSYWNTGDYPWVSIADLVDGGEVVATRETVSGKAMSNVFKSNPVPKDTLLMSFKLTIGKISRLSIPAFHNEAIIRIRPHLSALDPYLFKVLPYFARHGKTKGAIKGATLNRSSIAKIVVALPPLDEQHIIAAKVDELMGLCDGLKEQLTNAQTARSRLLEAALHEALPSVV